MDLVDRFSTKYKIFTSQFSAEENIDPKYHQVAMKIFDTLSLFEEHSTWPIPPFSNHELQVDISHGKKVIKKFRDQVELLIQTANLEKTDLLELIQNYSARDIQHLQGIRVTPGSLNNFILFPKLEKLAAYANEMYNDYLTHLARARAKHSLRCEVQYWGEVNGSPTEQNEIANEYLTKLFREFTWWNAYGHFKHDLVLELRDPTGHGMRWDLENKSFLGFVEPIDPELGRQFFENDIYKN